eukprot:GEMP01035450.1.p1 GENE.GEMP01035450.1~~GEMP01035450.1.p1  ORF type:complete len:290 (+),score=57.22 GEMP01035450.1:52-921(+)
MATSGTMKVEFGTAALGMDIAKDQVKKVTAGGQADTKGVKIGWTISSVNGSRMSATSNIRDALEKARKSGKKFPVVFSKPTKPAQATKNPEDSKVKDEVETETDKKDEAESTANVAEEQASGAEPVAAPAEEETQPEVAAEVVPIPQDGPITLKYYNYTETFTIAEGKITSKEVDEHFCLSDVMPGCAVHLGAKEPTYGEEVIYIQEDPLGTFVGLQCEETYWVYVVQDAAQEKKDMERMRKIWAGQVASTVTRAEGCSCLCGNPCTDKYVCKDWENRMAVARANGYIY